MAQKKYTIGIRLDKPTLAGVIRAAKKESRTKSNWVLLAISEKLERDGKGN